MAGLAGLSTCRAERKDGTKELKATGRPGDQATTDEHRGERSLGLGIAGVFSLLFARVSHLLELEPRMHSQEEFPGFSASALSAHCPPEERIGTRLGSS